MAWNYLQTPEVVRKGFEARVSYKLSAANLKQKVKLQYQLLEGYESDSFEFSDE